MNFHTWLLGTWTLGQKIVPPDFETMLVKGAIALRRQSHRHPAGCKCHSNERERNRKILIPKIGMGILSHKKKSAIAPSAAYTELDAVMVIA